MEGFVYTDLIQEWEWLQKCYSGLAHVLHNIMPISKLLDIFILICSQIRTTHKLLVIRKSKCIEKNPSPTLDHLSSIAVLVG